MDNMEQRRNRIVAFINERSSITFAELKKEFPNVSDMTLRTDLRALDEEKKIIRIHGGAKAVTTVLGNDDKLVLREVRNVTEKEQLVAKALKLIRPGTTVFLDSGSTTTMLARNLPDQPMMIFTCSLTVAMELNRLEQAEVFVVGGNPQPEQPQYVWPVHDRAVVPGEDRPGVHGGHRVRRKRVQLRPCRRERVETLPGLPCRRERSSDGFLQSGEEQHVHVLHAGSGRCPGE